MPYDSKPYDETRAHILEYAGDDWNSTRARSYIVAIITEHKKALKRASEELEFERKINSRVQEIFKGWFHHAG